MNEQVRAVLLGLGAGILLLSLAMLVKDIGSNKPTQEFPLAVFLGSGESHEFVCLDPNLTPIVTNRSTTTFVTCHPMAERLDNGSNAFSDQYSETGETRLGLQSALVNCYSPNRDGS